jgi:hypothetical protein
MAYNRIISARGRRYLQSVKSVWDPVKKRSTVVVLAHLGPCNKDGVLINPPKTRVENVHSTFSVGPLAVFYAAAKELRLIDHAAAIIQENAAKLLVCLALNQAIARVPIYRLPEWIHASPLVKWENLDTKSLSPRQFEDTLSAICYLSPEKTWENKGLVLQHELTKAWRGSSREPAGAYYDITKQQYYGSHCPYAQLGHHELGTTNVVSFGMVVSKEHHHPILCQALPGGQHDSLSVAPILEMLQGQGLKRLTMIMDRGMTAKENVRKAVDAGYDVIGSVKGWGKESVAYASQWPGEELEHPEYIVSTSHGGAVYARAFTAPIMGFQKMRIAVVENFFRKAQDRQARDLMLQELEGPVSKDRLKEIRTELGPVVIASKGRRGFSVDPDAVKREHALDGRFLLFSTNLSLDGPEMYRTYFAKDAIEKVFRTSKGELSLGPVRYRRKDRLDAYATVVYMSYLLWSWAERRLQEKYPEKSLAEALRSVEGVSWIRFGSGKLVREWATRLTKEQEQILSAVGAMQYVATY